MDRTTNEEVLRRIKENGSRIRNVLKSELDWPYTQKEKWREATLFLLEGEEFRIQIFDSNLEKDIGN